MILTSSLAVLERVILERRSQRQDRVTVYLRMVSYQW
jgi:hypothetical protein